MGLSLPQLWYSKAKWGDYNNDGFLDIMMMGINEGQTISEIYSNNGDGTFTNISGMLPYPLYDGDASWADYNNDGKLDILYGGTSNFLEKTVLMRNNGDSSMTDISGVKFPENISSIDWGDYNNDGYAVF
jgi:hypothetical protein